MHISNPNLAIDGVGASGIGAYHEKVGFDAFTHYKSMMRKPCWIDVPLRYPPYSKLKLKLVKLFIG